MLSRFIPAISLLFQTNCPLLFQTNADRFVIRRFVATQTHTNRGLAAIDRVCSVPVYGWRLSSELIRPGLNGIVLCCVVTCFFTWCEATISLQIEQRPYQMLSSIWKKHLAFERFFVTVLSRKRGTIALEASLDYTVLIQRSSYHQRHPSHADDHVLLLRVKQYA